MDKELVAALRKIGFNDSIGLGMRELHVQTEVLARDGIVIRTTVHEGGTVLHVDRQPVELGLTEVERLEALAQEQHRACLTRVARNELG